MHSDRNQDPVACKHLVHVSEYFLFIEKQVAETFRFKTHLQADDQTPGWCSEDVNREMRNQVPHVN